jgi:hypothetical protein
MSMFGKILGKLGLPKAQAAAAGAHQTPSATPASPIPASGSQSAAPSESAPAAVSAVDVAAHLDALAANNAQTLNWKQSIVDLLKLLDIDSRYAARKDLANELGCPAELMDDSARMNVWLHKTVLRRLAENGGRLPSELLD